MDSVQNVNDSPLVVDSPFPLYYLDGQTPSLLPERGSMPNRVVVHSIPKAGTYLLGKMLQLCGWLDTEIHLMADGFTDYRGKTVQQKREDYLKLLVTADTAEVAKAINEGQFVVGHLPCNPKIAQDFLSFKQLFIYRDLRDCLVSHMRFLEKRNNPSHDIWRSIPDKKLKFAKYLEYSGHEFFNISKPMISWADKEGIQKICFENLYGDAGKQSQEAEINQILDFLGIQLQGTVNDLIKDTFGANTLTWSGKRSNREEYWSEEAQRLFVEYGGVLLNQRLGYRSPDSRSVVNSANHEINGGFSSSAVVKLERLLNAEDILKALAQFEADLDQELLELVKYNAQAAFDGGQIELAQALENLAIYIEGVLDKTLNSAPAHQKEITQTKGLKLSRNELEALEMRGIFIVGNGRSGTSVFCDCLNSSSEIYMLQEGHLFQHATNADFVQHFNQQHQSFGNNRFKGTYIPPAKDGPISGLEFYFRMSKHYKYVGEKIAFGLSDALIGNLTIREAFFEFQARYFYHSTYYVIIRHPFENILSMHKMWPEYPKQKFISCWLESLRTLMELYCAFPKVHVVFFDQLSPDTIVNISGLLDVEIELPEGMLDPHYQKSKIADGKLPPAFMKYENQAFAAEKLFNTLKNAFDQDDFMYKQAGHKRKFFKNFQIEIQHLLSSLES